MNLNIKMGKNFTTTFNKMCEKYGEEFELLNGFHETQMNYTDFIDNFTKDNVADTTIDPNANVGNKDIVTLNSEKGKSHDKLFCFNKIFYEMQKKYGIQAARDWLEAEWSGAFYLNNSSTSTQKPYCFSYSLERLATEGLFFLENYNNQPPQHLDSFNQMVVEYVSYVSARSSGACGLGDYLYWSFYFWYKDKMAGKFWQKINGEFVDCSEREMRQEFQRIIYRLNQPFLRVDQSAFTNMSIYDRIYLEELFGALEFPNAENFDKGSFVIDYIEDLVAYEKAFMEEIKEIKKVETFTFPVLSYNLIYRNGKFADEEFAKWACRQNMEFNEANFLFSEDPTTTSQCCRILNNPKNLKGFMSSIGGAALNIGSVQVNNINLARIAYESEGNEEKFFKILKERTTLCQMVLDVIRHIITRNVEKGLLKNYQRGIIDMKKQFSTIGIVAAFEATEIMGYINEDEFGNKFYSDKGLIFVNKILDCLNEWKEEFECDYSWNIENTPAENCAKVLARKDELIFNVKRKRPVYSNQWIPLMEQTTIQEKLRLGAILDKKCGGGQISHITIDKPFSNFDTAWKILNKVAESGIIYFAFNCAISKCANKHIFHGNICPKCGQAPIDTYTRVVGFITRMSAWSKERQEEGKKRYVFDLKELID